MSAPPTINYNEEPISSQPGVPRTGNQPNWMERPVAPMGCPPGLEYLSLVDTLLVSQQVEMLEVITDFEMANRYKINNSKGQQVYYAEEESDTCHRICCKEERGFVMHITDNNRQEVIRVERPFKCCAGCCWCASSNCCAMEIEVQAPVGTTCGYVRQTGSCWTSYYDILDAQGKPIFKIKSPCCICDGPCCTNDQEFQILQLDGIHQIGRISKQWKGFVEEMFTKADNFGVSFPVDLDVKTKATILGAVFLIDFMHFEHSDNDHGDS